MTKQFEDRTRDLVTLGVFVLPKDKEPADLSACFRDLSPRAARAVDSAQLVFAGLAAALVGVVDLVPTVTTYLRGTPDKQICEWAVAAICAGKIQIDPHQNLLFACVATAVEAAYVFILSWWLANSVVYFYLLRRIVRGFGTIEFKPWLSDPDRRLGLGGLASAFDTYFVCTAAVALWALLDRVHSLWFQKLPVTQLLWTLATKSDAIEKLLQAEAPPSIGSLAKVTVPSIIGLLINALPPLAAASVALAIRGRINDLRYERWRELGERTHGPTKQPSKDEHVEVCEELGAYAHLEAWPNGSLHARLGLFVVLALSVGALLPVFLLPIGAAMLATRTGELKAGVALAARFLRSDDEKKG
jgi:hypothetical protein